MRDERAAAATALLAAGDRAPDAAQLRRPFVGHPLRLHERIGCGRHVLLRFVAEEAAVTGLFDMLRLLRLALGDSTAELAIASPSAIPDERAGLPLLTDSADEFVTAYSAQPGTAWLVRPNGHVGWSSAAPSVTGLCNALETIVRIPPAAAQA